VAGRPCGRSRPSVPRGSQLDRLILDTSVLVDAERNAAELDATIADDDDVAIAAITAAELLVGVELASGRRRERRAAFVEELLATISVEDYGLRTARAHSALLAVVRRIGSPRGAHDLIIAATAVSTGRVLVTNDASGFDDLPGVQIRRIRT
jgi:tRNA(fMet)-specific endonuclease VapC